MLYLLNFTKYVIVTKHDKKLHITLNKEVVEEDSDDLLDEYAAQYIFFSRSL